MRFRNWVHKDVDHEKNTYLRLIEKDTRGSISQMTTKDTKPITNKEPSSIILKEADISISILL